VSLCEWMCNGVEYFVKHARLINSFNKVVGHAKNCNEAAMFCVVRAKI